jgi:hypothetical protein
MPIEPEGWHMDAGPPSWDPKAQTFSFLLHKQGCQSVACVVGIDVLERVVHLHDLSELVLGRVFDAHRQMLELRAAQKLNAGLLDANGTVLLGPEDI